MNNFERPNPNEEVGAILSDIGKYDSEIGDDAKIGLNGIESILNVDKVNLQNIINDIVNGLVGIEGIDYNKIEKTEVYGFNMENAIERAEDKIGEPLKKAEQQKTLKEIIESTTNERQKEIIQSLFGSIKLVGFNSKINENENNKTEREQYLVAIKEYINNFIKDLSFESFEMLESVSFKKEEVEDTKKIWAFIAWKDGRMPEKNAVL